MPLYNAEKETYVNLVQMWRQRPWAQRHLDNHTVETCTVARQITILDLLRKNLWTKALKGPARLFTPQVNVCDGMREIRFG